MERPSGVPPHLFLIVAISEMCDTASNDGVYSAHSLIATAVGALN